MFYLFDFDGTLVDSMPFWAGTHIKALTENGIPCPENYAQIITPLGNVKATELAVSLGVKATVEEHLKKVNAELYRGYTTEIELKSTVREVLLALKAAGHSLNVLTASPHLYVDPCLERLQVAKLFDQIWTIEDFDRTKDDPVIYHMAAQRLGTSVENCIFVDDNLTAITTAKQAGMKTIAVYDSLSETFAERMKETADRYVWDFAEIII